MIKTTVESQWNGEEVKIRGNRVRNKSAFEIGLVVERQAKALCPIKSGMLAGSITTQSQTEGTSPEAPATESIQKPGMEGEVFVGTPVEYGPYVEFGTWKMDAQPYLRPALDLAQGKVLTIVEIEAKKQFKEYWFPRGTTFKDRGGTK